MDTYENNPVRESGNRRGKRKERLKGSTFLLYLHDIIYLLAIVMVLLLVFFRIVVVSGSSMKNTLVDGDYLLLISNVFYRNPEQGDIVVISKDSFDDGAPIVKRVIATEGQYVRFDSGNVYVGDTPELEQMTLLEEDYISSPTISQDSWVKVAEGCIFVMGDNRNTSQDARYWRNTYVSKDKIIGKAGFIYYPFDRIGVVE